MDIETELKLRVSPAMMARLRRHPLLRARKKGDGRPTHLRSVYFDTEDLALMRKHMALRVRHIGRQRIQTVKAPVPGARSAAQVHREWATEIASDRPDLRRIADPALRAALAGDAIGRDLRAMFVADIRRSTVPVKLAGALIEVALDEGEIAAGGGRAAVCEAELELKSGAPARLFELALKLHEKVPFTVEHRTKAARGYALATGEGPKPAKAPALALDAGAETWAGFVAVVRHCLHHLRANEDCACRGEDSEGVHQLRVALRRLRAALGVFRPVLPADRGDRMAAALRWVQQQLAPARDLDVFREETLAPLMARVPEEKSLARLAEAVNAARREAYEAVRATLGERRYTRLQLQFELWLGSGGEGGDAASLAAPLWPFARAAIDERLRKARKLAKRIDKLDDEARHDLRIQAKKARYALEFFHSLLPKKPARRMQRRLADVQDRLGSLNDSAVAAALVRNLEKRHGETDHRARDLLAGWFAARIAADRPRAAAACKELVKLKAFW